MKKLIIAIACVSMMISCKKSETNNVEPTYCCQCVDYHEKWEAAGTAKPPTGYRNPQYDTSTFDTCGITYATMQMMNKKTQVDNDSEANLHTIYCTVKP